VYDDLFTTVPNAETGGIFETTEQLPADAWARLLESGIERYVDDESDDHRRPVPPPQLHDDWLSPAEREARRQN